VFPRERLQEPSFRTVLEKSGRHRLLEILLTRMLAPAKDRIATAAEVIRELETIEAWERNARLSPLSPAATAAIARIQQQESDIKRNTEENNAARISEADRKRQVKAGVEDWLRVELEAAAAHIQASGLVECHVTQIEISGNPHFRIGRTNSSARPIGGMELRLHRPNDSFKRDEALKLLLCEQFEVQITFGRHTPPRPERDLEFLFFPYYCRYETRTHSTSEWAGFLNREPNPPSAQRRRSSHTAVSKSFIGGNVTVASRFRLSQWPVVQEDLRSTLTESIEIFFKYIESGASTIGP